MKTISKKLLSLLVTLTLILGLTVPASLAASSDFNIKDGVLIEYTGSDPNITIPDGVTEIGESAFEECILLTEVTIPGSVTSIGDRAFKGCLNLRHLTLENGIQKIGNQAFFNCGLIALAIPGSVKSIGTEAFSQMLLMELTIENGVESIGDSAFSGNLLETVVIPKSVTNIGAKAFADCELLLDVSIEGSQVTIAKDAFDGCPHLPKISMLTPGLSMSTSDFTISNGYLKKYTGPGGDVVIPQGVIGIDYRAFDGCDSVTSVIIPEGVTIIFNEAFRECTNLISVTIPESVTSIRPGAFLRCTSLTSIVIPAGVTSLDSEVPVEINGRYMDVAYSGEFAGCASLTNVTILGKDTHISWETFAGCHPDLIVYIPEGSAAQQTLSALEINYEVGLPPASPTGTGADQSPEVIETGTAYPSTQLVLVDGSPVEFQCYALKDANGNDTNYIKLRDVADILNGSAVQFQVGWDGDITITTGQSYTKNGSEHSTPFSGPREYKKTAARTLVDGQAAQLDTFQLYDDNGGGFTYYKLRDLGSALGFLVDWTPEKGIFIETK